MMAARRLPTWVLREQQPVKMTTRPAMTARTGTARK